MRRNEWEITEPSEIEAVLQKAQVIHLAMSGESGPYVVPMNFAYADGRIYLHGSTKGKRAEMLRADPRVSFCVEVDVELIRAEKACKWGARYRSVIGFGMARFLEGAEDKLRGLGLLMAHYGGVDSPIDERVAAKTSVIEIEISSVTGQRKGYDE